MNTQISVGAVIGRTFDIYGKRFGLLIGLAAVLLIPAGIIQAILRDTGVVGALIGFVVQIVAVTLYTGAVVRVVQAESNGSEPGSVGDILNSVSDRIWPLFWVGLVAAVAMVFGFVLLVIPYLILLTIWAVFQPVIVVEHISFDSLKRSRELVKGNGWNVFGVIVVVFLLQVAVVLVGGVLGAIVGGVVGTLIITVILMVLFLPIEGLVHSVMYFSLAGQGGGGSSEVAPPPPPPAPAG